MPAVYFYKIDEVPATIRGVETSVWHIRLEENGEEYYIRADKVKSTLQRGRYWSDQKHLIEIRATQKSEFGSFKQKGSEMKPIDEPNVYQQVSCGHCGQVNLVQIDPIVQGAHSCVKCKSTICIISGKQMQLKNGAKAGNTVLREAR